MDRRDFLNKGLVFAGVGLAIPILSLLSSCERTETMPVGDKLIELNLKDFPELLKVGGALKKNFDNLNSGYPIIIIRKSESEFLALSSRCTHQGCIVNLPVKPNETLDCPCHGSKFSSSDGSVIEDPTDGEKILPLQRFDTNFDSSNGILKIMLK